VDLADGDILPESWLDIARADVNYGVVAGGSLASASTLTITSGFHQVTGVVSIDTITDPLGAVPGQPVVLAFTGTTTVVTGTGNIRLRSGLNYITLAGDVMKLVYDGANWVQVTSQLSQNSLGQAVLPGGLILDGGALNGAGLYSAYNPVMGASVTPPTLGTGGSSVGRYAQLGKYVRYRGRWYIGAGGPINVGSGTYRIPLPVAAQVAITDGRLGGSVNVSCLTGGFGGTPSSYGAVMGAKLDGVNSGYFIVGAFITISNYGGFETEGAIGSTFPGGTFFSAQGGIIAWDITYEAA
jgi:hypothetical protein